MHKLTVAIAVFVGGLASAQVMGGLVGKRGAIEAKSGSTLNGTYAFSLGKFKGVKLVVQVTGAPEGEHAVHIHENPDCSARASSRSPRTSGRWGRATQRPTCSGTRS
jgi:Cu/Zn superoxide dismutase